MRPSKSDKQEKDVKEEMQICDLDFQVDAAGTVEVARVSPSVVKAVVKAVSDVVVSVINSTQR